VQYYAVQNIGNAITFKIRSDNNAVNFIYLTTLLVSAYYDSNIATAVRLPGK